MGVNGALNSQVIIDLLMTPCYTLELVRAVTGESLLSVIRPLAATLNRPPCGCTRPAKHKGWCAPRRQLVDRIQQRRELGTLPVQQAMRAVVNVPVGHCKSDAACPFPVYLVGLCKTHYRDALSLNSLAPSTYGMLYELRHLYVL